MTDRLAEIKARNERDKTIHEAMGIPLPQQWLDEMWLISEVERLRPDAERWRYVREHGCEAIAMAVDDEVWVKCRLDEADAAVDAARKAT